MVETSSQNPYSAALHKNFDSESQEEPLSALNEADLLWSILKTCMCNTEQQLSIPVSNP